jgi:hypothetical protein
VLIDAEGLLATLYGFRAVPNGWVIDADGVIRFRHIGGFDIRRPEAADAVEAVLTGAATSSSSVPPGPHEAAMRVFQGVRLLRQGKPRAAVDAWVRAAEADPENRLVRKQVWHLLYPDRFEPQVDFAWQKAQMEREARLGIRAANPLPDTLR